MKFIFTTLAFATLSGVTFGQSPPFIWKETTTKPEAQMISGNTSLAIDKTTGRIFVGTGSGKLFISDDAGANWVQTLKTNGTVNKIAAVKGTYVYAATDTSIFYSHDNGNTWSEVRLKSEFPVTDILVGQNGYVYASTAGIADIGNGVGDFRGAGIFRSRDNGQIWDRFFTVFDNAAPVYHLAEDSKGRIFASLNISRGVPGAILYANGPDSSWNYLPVTIMDWSQGEYDTMRINSVYTLEIDKNDSIYFSFEGGSTPGANGNSVAASGTLKNSLERAERGENWKHMRVIPPGFIWYYQPVHSLFFPSSGTEKYSSIQHAGNTTWGGSYFTSSNLGGWVRRHNGIVPVSSGYSIHHYAEDSLGNVYVIQEYDPRVYVADTTSPTSVPGLGIADNSVSIYPNPASSSVTIASMNSPLLDIKMYDLSGRLVNQINDIVEQAKTVSFGNMDAGLYVVHITTPKGVRIKKLTVMK